MQNILVELCSGSSAIARHFCGLPKILGFMGAKDRYVHQILSLWKCPKPDKIILNDLGYWGIIWSAISHGLTTDIADAIYARSKLDAKSLFYDLKQNKDNGSLAERAAARLLLLSSTYGGGEIGGFKGNHKLRPSVDGYIPSRKSLAERIGKLKLTIPIEVTTLDASSVLPFSCYCYIDPPYLGFTSYENTLSRENVLETAKRWHKAGASVAISEAEPLDVYFGKDWQSYELKTNSGQFRKNARCQIEWLTINEII